jgi:hypothetical protein
MTVRENIDLDVQALTRYFNRLFVLINELAGTTADQSEGTYVGDYAVFVRPDMACNVYNFVDFWLARLADFHQQRGRLPLYKKRGSGSDLDAYHKYFTEVARLPLDSLASSLDQLDSLRKVRNCLVHHGAHVKARQSTELEAIHGVSLFGTLVLLSDKFVWDCLKHASLYLCAVGEAGVVAP